MKYTTDGQNWTQFNSGSGLAFISHRAYAPNTGKYYLVTSGFAGGSSQLCTSSNGTSWSNGTTLPSIGVYGPVSSDGDNFIIGTSNTTYYTSSDGDWSNWTQRTAPSPITGTNGLFYAGSRAYIALNPSGGKFHSTGDVTNTSSWDTETFSDPNLVSFSSTGFNLLTASGNADGKDTVAWSFMKSKRFMDIVTYSGTGSNRTVNHNLGSVPGLIIIKRTDSTGNWETFHRSLGPTGSLDLKSSAGFQTSSSRFNDTAPTSTQFTVGTNHDVNQSGGSYIAYLFAHNDGDGGFGSGGDQDIIKCGKYAGQSSGGTDINVNLGFEPQWLLFKVNASSQWYVLDNMRGISSNGNDERLYAGNTSTASLNNTGVSLTPTGFTVTAGSEMGYATGYDIVYMAIRRGPFAQPENATDVFTMDAQGNSTEPAFTSNFTVDMGFISDKAGDPWYLADRLRGPELLRTEADVAEAGDAAIAAFDYMDGWGSNLGLTSHMSWMWKRAPGYFDCVAFSGTGSATTVNHGLNATPEMMWVKERNGGRNWAVYHSALGGTKYLYLNTTDAEAAHVSIWNNTAPTSSVFSVGTANNTNRSGGEYIAYLFATLAGISKVGTYTGNSTDGKQIDCGFSNGARFVLLKNATVSNTNWLLFDTVRGIEAGNDSRLYLNTNDGENTGTDYIDPYSSGFALTANAQVNYSGSTYIFYAIA